MHKDCITTLIRNVLKYLQYELYIKLSAQSIRGTTQIIKELSSSLETCIVHSSRKFQ